SIPSPARRCNRGSGIVPVHMKRAGIGNPFVSKLFRPQSQTAVAFPKNSTFAGVIDQDDGLLAGASRSCHQMCFDAQPFKFRPMNRGGTVLSYFADVPGSQAPLLARS